MANCVSDGVDEAEGGDGISDMANKMVRKFRRIYDMLLLILLTAGTLLKDKKYASLS